MQGNDKSIFKIELNCPTTRAIGVGRSRKAWQTYRLSARWKLYDIISAKTCLSKFKNNIPAFDQTAALCRVQLNKDHLKLSTSQKGRIKSRPGAKQGKQKCTHWKIIQVMITDVLIFMYKNTK